MVVAKRCQKKVWFTGVRMGKVRANAKKNNEVKSTMGIHQSLKNCFCIRKKKTQTYGQNVTMRRKRSSLVIIVRKVQDVSILFLGGRRDENDFFDVISHHPYSLKKDAPLLKFERGKNSCSCTIVVIFVILQIFSHKF